MNTESTADKASLSFYFQPPIGQLEAGKPQLLQLQFTNHSQEDIAIPSVSPQGLGCFTLTPEKNEDALKISPGQTHVSRYWLGLSKEGDDGECIGRQPLSFSYAYSARETDSNGKLNPMPTSQERQVSTGPILIAGSRRLVWLRFFHIFAVVAIPLLLVMAPFVIQGTQNITAERVKERELELEVWKTIFPKIDGYFCRYYVPIYRQMELLHEELKRVPQVTDDVIALLFVLRARYLQLGESIGGYYFRSNAAEDACALLSNELWDECRKLAGMEYDLFEDAVKTLEPEEDRLDAKKHLFHWASKQAKRDFLTAFGKKLIAEDERGKIDMLLTRMMKIIAFEVTFLWYPEWYKQPPKLDMSALESAESGSSSDESDSWKEVLKKYRKELPSECIRKE